MIRITPLLYIVVCVISVSLIAGAILTQYVWGEPFYDFLGPVTVRGSQINATDGNVHTITRASVSYRGFVFDFDKPLVQITDARVSSRHSIQSYRKESDTLMLYFDGDIELHFHLPPGVEDELLIRVRDPQNILRAGGGDYLAFDYRCPQDKCAMERRIIGITEKGVTNYLYLPPDATLDRSRIRISLHNPVRTLQFSTTYIPQLLEELYAVATQLLVQSAIDPTDLMQQFIRRAYDSWQQHSYIVAQGQWVDREGGAQFDEAIMLANLSEALKQNEYTRTFNAMRRAYQQNREKTTIQSLLYVGDGFFAAPNFSANERRREDAVATLIGSDSLFNDADMLRYLYFRAPRETSQAFAAHVARSDYFNLTTHQLLNMLEYLMFDLPSNRAIIEEIIFKRIVPHLFITRNGIFIKSTEDNVDFIITLRAAFVLRRFALFADRAQLLRIASALRHSTLSLADESAYIPQYASLKNNRIASVHGYIDSATVYRYISDDAHYSRHTALDVEERLWMMSPVATEVVRVTSRRIQMRVMAPSEHSFYLVIGNSDRPRQVQIGDTPYSSQSAFETRIRGWYWFDDHRLLVIKFHRGDTSDSVVIDY